MLRLIQGEPCPKKRAEATRERHERAAVSDPNDLRFWLQRGFFEARDERAREGARSLLARAEGEPATLDGMPVDDLIEMALALESAPALGPEGA